ncbi:DUF6153 family protein [Streptomyces sp. Je 1-332]|uniref:DUF6153 family protein n=1 Tax=Streptomyces sp. Je 1-332 TaxID=3231270 RepID=UPI00345A4D2B
MKRSAIGGRQLLLLAALLFGIVTMHTLGHPTGHPTGNSPGPATGHHSSSPARDNSATDRPTTNHSATDRPTTNHPTNHSATVRSTTDHSASQSSGIGMGGMDPLSVCLAVLAAFTLVLLLKAGLLRPGGFGVPARVPARLLDGLRPNPPPPRILLSHLSVLRI